MDRSVLFVGLAVTVLMDVLVDRCLGHDHSGQHHDHAAGGDSHATELTAGTAEPTGEGQGKSEAEGEGKGEVDKDALMRVSWVTISGVNSHNRPEGLAVVFTPAMPIPSSSSIAARNVPLCAARAVPVYQSTQSYAMVFRPSRYLPVHRRWQQGLAGLAWCVQAQGPPMSS